MKDLAIDPVSSAIDAVTGRLAEVRRLALDLHQLFMDLRANNADTMVPVDAKGTTFEIPANAILLAKRAELGKRQGILEDAVRELHTQIQTLGKLAVLDDTGEEEAVRTMASNLAPIRAPRTAAAVLQGEGTGTPTRQVAGT